MKLGLPPPARRALLAYAPAFIGAAVWAHAKFPEQTRWAADIYGRAFGYLAAFYDDWTKVEGYEDAFDEAILEIRGIPRRILDVATGTGFVARRLKRLYPSSEVVGVDVAPEMLAIAQHDAVADGVEVAFRVADSSGLPFEDGSFDLVIMQNSIPFPEEMMRVVGRGGKAMVVMSFAGPWVALAWPAVSERLARAGAVRVWGRRAGPGFYGVAVKAA